MRNYINIFTKTGTIKFMIKPMMTTAIEAIAPWTEPSSTPLAEPTVCPAVPRPRPKPMSDLSKRKALIKISPSA